MSFPPHYQVFYIHRLEQIDVQSAEDVQKAFEFSKATGVHLSIKASGHDYKGRSSLRGSLSLWVRHFLYMCSEGSLTDDCSFPRPEISAVYVELSNLQPHRT